MVPVKRQHCGIVLCGFMLALLLILVNPFPVLAAEGKEKQEGVRADQLIDKSVRNDRGQDLGEVDDLIMSRRGKIKKVILDVGGFLGIGDRLISVPFRSLKISKEGDVLYPASKEQLEKHPIFNYEREGLWSTYFSPVPPYGTFAIGRPGPYGRHFPYGHPYNSSPGGGYEGNYGAWGWEFYPERFRVDGILDRSVWNEEGIRLGKIEDLIIDSKGQVQTLILSVGWSLGMKEKLVALPFHPLRVSGAGIVLDLTRRQLEEMPSFRFGEK